MSTHEAGASTAREIFNWRFGNVCCAWKRKLWYWVRLGTAGVDGFSSLDFNFTFFFSDTWPTCGHVGSSVMDYYYWPYKTVVDEFVHV